MNRQIDVCLSPELLNLYELEGRIVVVIDVLRATSCMVTGLAEGVESIHPVATLDQCLQLAGSGYLTAAERGGEQVAGFDLGNSPRAYLNGAFAGRKVAITTTNGTLAITKSAPFAKQVLIGAFLNLNALAEYLRQQPEDVVLLCAGWKGKVNMEDTLFAGALISELEATHTLCCDAPLVSKTLYQAVKEDLFGYLMQSSHAQRLSKFGVEEDIRFCLQADQYGVIPVLKGEELVVLPSTVSQ
ncbi:2-phosphosulfolactate phosphatase [Cesiribacter andamanensis]|uniref:Probable 2-phosphosulfolactate phosphatase n=1 Tax=Cesiribacter andamanensis AMV16 TaxID=1279009 RepID=M7N073_9BACT|nr:2-phosphosulfolactate phosphatase [Cesiribacter andamanensis]EMR02093.1 putative 2-phosphosulfolactate phosphatase [Cesiribacter andamanensis AMV16]